MNLVILAACATAAPTPPSLPGPVVTLRVRGAALHAHVADDPAERERGLMEVTTLGVDEGMVFVYPSPAVRYFWMKDTPTALSIAYCDAVGAIVTIAEMTPLDRTLTPSNVPVLYAVEARKGWFAEHEVRVGDKILGLPGPAAR